MNSVNKEETLSDTSSSDQYLSANNLRICYSEYGEKNNPAILLIMGLATQMIAWSDEFCQSLADGGYRVIRFDNRDIGLSEKITNRKPASLPKLMLRRWLGLKLNIPYTLHDMADDAIGILDALKIEKAHFVGASMGGMIAQLITAKYPCRSLSLTSIMSSSGNPKLPRASSEVTKVIMKRPKTQSENDIVNHGIKVWRIIESPDYPTSDELLKTKILESFRRSHYPQGLINQLVAIIENGDRREFLRQITAPTLVIHGKADALVPIECGIDTAKYIENSDLKLIEGMGHDLPKELVPRLVDMIIQHIEMVN
ncbi:MAG: alpha/beta hydrolase [Kangiella sp.]|nr:MAG: alpha/beta hydrolase [Kangiella sp.]